MNGKVRLLTLTAMLTALCVVLLYISAVLPTMRLAIVTVAGLLTAAAIIENGIAAGIFLFTASSLLGLLISPLRGNILIYMLFFGYYPIAKGIIEKIRLKPMEWALKLLLFNLALTAAALLYRKGFLSGIELPQLAVYLFYLAANAAFVVYDIAFSGLIAWYLRRFKKRG